MSGQKSKGPKPVKIDEVADLRNVFESSKGAIMTDYRGLDVKRMSALRKRLRDVDATYRVAKNTLMKRAANGLPAESLVSDLEGPTAIAFTTGDPAATAKVLAQFIRENKLPVVKGGIADGFIMDPTQVQVLATMPPREVLLAQVVGGLQAPVTSLVSTMQQLYAGFVYTVQSYAEKKD